MSADLIPWGLGFGFRGARGAAAAAPTSWIRAKMRFQRIARLSSGSIAREIVPGVCEGSRYYISAKPAWCLVFDGKEATASLIVSAKDCLW